MRNKSIRKSLLNCMIIWIALTLSSCIVKENPHPGNQQNQNRELQDTVADFSGPESSVGSEILQTGDLNIKMEDAIIMALTNNRSLVVEKLNPMISETYESQASSKFDPNLSTEVALEKNKYKRQSSSGLGNSGSDALEVGIELSEYFPTGTSLAAQVSYTQTDSEAYADLFSSFRLGLSMTQALLQGFGSEVNLVDLRQARLDTAITTYELRGFVEFLVMETEFAFWDYALALRQIEIVEESLELAGKQLAETQEMIKVGTLAESEVVAVQAEVASQNQKLINAKSNMETNRLQLLQLLNPPSENLWDRDIIVEYPPFLPEVKFDTIANHVLLALQTRPEINQAVLEIQQNQLEIIRTKNGLLPRLDLFITLGKTGYADSFGSATQDLDEDSYDAQIGVTIEYPVYNRNAAAKHRRQLILRNQAQTALENLKQTVELDIRSSYIEVQRTREQIAAGAATRKLQDEKLRIETEKFRVGRSTGYLVAQAQRDLLAEKIEEVRALVYYLKALTNFYRMEGSLLVRRGVSAPGKIEYN
jgi:outer membrane protein